ncbi:MULTISPECIES: hypothetical protein [unclassified Methylophaga]|jgi:hypothetical protein|uniref:hypothetical protein n=1 Tax=unclassified Methylophaga TaxID=2629249 RepID=UPI000C3FBCB7|nr:MULTISPECIES: hypothetical protein [unclassified Methylophaga]MAL49943.1 hypothetical protein [Methylophaga sp.]MAM28684.1 hypothetical protein [Flavobacteriaceae bacterium]MBP24819.1 hypothetical protein [Methylophaga sp.]HCC80939.1 hypothetical protein [Methylophaga sp.]|tara:strand:+ start:9255 stop:9725 length:471 start_codon:yes stop_codon:yes gene_type:complete
MKKVLLLAFISILFSTNVYSEDLCETHERVSFACDFKSKSVSVCRNDKETLIYRFGSQQKIELELTSDIHFSRVAYSGGGEGNLTFFNGNYRYVVYSSISNGAWLDDGSREKVERAGIYVVKGDKLLKDIECQSYPGKSFIHDLPAFEEKEFRYYK